MRIFRFFFIVAFVLGLFSCSNKELEEESLLPKDVILKALNGHTELSDFTTAFNEVDFSSIKANNLTVFAVPNGLFNNNSGLKSSAVSPCEDMIVERHIIEGQYTQTDLTDSLFLNSLDGTVLLITIIEGHIFINGAELTDLIPASENAIFVVDKTIPCSSPEPPENPEIPVTGLTVSQPVLSLEVGKTETIALIINPLNATNKKLTWQIDKTGIIEITSMFDSDSLFSITAITEGTAQITFTMQDGGYSATCVVTVKDKSGTDENGENGEDDQPENPNIPVTGIWVRPPILSLDLGKTEILSVSAEPASATDRKIIWNIDNPDIVEIAVVATDTLFSISAKKAGTAIITFATSDGDYKATCVVTVTNTTAAISFNKISNSFIAFLDREKTIYFRRFI